MKIFGMFLRYATNLFQINFAHIQYCIRDYLNLGYPNPPLSELTKARKIFMNFIIIYKMV